MTNCNEMQCLVQNSQVIFCSLSGDSSSDRSATPEPGLSYEHLSQGKSFLKKKKEPIVLYINYLLKYCVYCVFLNNALR